MIFSLANENKSRGQTAKVEKTGNEKKKRQSQKERENRAPTPVYIKPAQSWRRLGGERERAKKVSSGI